MKSQQDKKQHSIGLCIPGGLAGQLFGVAYAAWINQNLNMGCRIIFFDVGTSISKLSIDPIIESDVAQEMGVSLAQIRGNLDWDPSKMVTTATLLVGRVRGSAIYRALSRLAKLARLPEAHGSRPSDRDAESVIRSTHLKGLRPGSRIAGYPTDYQIVEDSTSSLFKLMDASGLPNFLEDPGQENTISIHWRLGDYVKNPTHGALSWSFMSSCLEKLPLELPVSVYSDSPDLARTLIKQAGERREIQVVSGEIFEDLFQMTRSKYFIGSHSGISFLAALALHHSETDSTVVLPGRWFRNDEENKKFRETAGVFGSAVRVEATYLD